MNNNSSLNLIHITISFPFFQISSPRIYLSWNLLTYYLERVEFIRSIEEEELNISHYKG